MKQFFYLSIYFLNNELSALNYAILLLTYPDVKVVVIL